MPARVPPHLRKPHHVAGRNVYVSIETYHPRTANRKAGKRHRGSIVLKRWPVSEVRRIIIEAFRARQAPSDTPVQWADEVEGPNAENTKS